MQPTNIISLILNQGKLFKAKKLLFDKIIRKSCKHISRHFLNLVSVYNVSI